MPTKTSRLHAVSPVATAASPTQRFAGTRVLLVEDDACLRELLRHTLEGWGMAVTEVIQGDQVMAAARRTKPDVILLDLFLPGKDGFEVIREFRRGQSPAQIIAMTGAEFFQNRALREISVLLGAHRILLKPFEPAALELALAGLPLPDQPDGPGESPVPAGMGETEPDALPNSIL